MAKVRKLLLLVCIYLHVVKDSDCVVNDAQDVNIINEFSSLYNTLNRSATENHNIVHTPEALFTTPDFARKYGYPVESHTVTTEDGYLLTVHRIPDSPRLAWSGVKRPVLLMHGFTACSDTFLLLGPGNGLGFILADQGYDVWMANARGNFYSRNHVKLSPNDPKFWQFTWHEIGVYDLPATIDHILQTTNQRQLFYVGHSMGTTVFFVLTSTRPEYNKKIRLGVNMAPAVFHNSARSVLLKTFAPNVRLIYMALKAAGMDELGARTKTSQLLLSQVCREGNPLLEVCFFIFNTAFGLHRETFDLKKADIIFSHLFAGASIYTAVHYAQNFNEDRFQVYDPTVTLGKRTQEYNLSQVSAPVFILYAENDYLFHPNAVMRLISHLPNVVRVHRVPDLLASHTDFVFSKYGARIIYDEMINEMNRNR